MALTRRAFNICFRMYIQHKGSIISLYIAPFFLENIYVYLQNRTSEQVFSCNHNLHWGQIEVYIARNRQLSTKTSRKI